ncbi:unnamed protein product [Rotaria sp. Silwood2]|nr:unnamed protein product [Rotaria sp. Silwood2]
MVRPTQQFSRHHDKRYNHKHQHQYSYPLTFYLDMSVLPTRKYRQPRTQRLTTSNFQDDMLKLHNDYRARHCIRPLSISQRLSRIAQSHAEYLAATSKFEHSGHTLGDEYVGENLHMEWIYQGKTKPSAKLVAKSWYDEIALHDFENPTFLQETAHFTQMVWKSTRKLGVGFAYSPDQTELYVVANYYPAGNIEEPGFFEANVLPPTC